MGTSASNEPDSDTSDQEVDGVAGTLAGVSEQTRELVDAVKPNNPERIQMTVKILFSLVLTALFMYWILAYQYEVVWFEF